MKSLLRISMFLAAAAFFPAGLAGQTPGGAPPAPAAVPAGDQDPRIQFNTETYDFGKIVAGDPVKYTFIATNTGTGTLEITDARGSCSCTVVGGGSAGSAWTLQRAAPGQTCLIPVEIATANYRGQVISKTVTVTSNDKSRPSVSLQIHGDVWIPVDVEPAMVSFVVSAGAATNQAQTVKIINRMDVPLSVSAPQCTTNAFSVVLKTNVPGQEYELTVAAAPAGVVLSGFQVASIQGEITLQASVPSVDPIRIGVYESIQPEITVYPPSIQLPAGPLAQASVNHISIRGNSGSLKLFDPAVNVPGPAVSLNVIQTNRQYYISAVFPKGYEFQPGQSVVVSVKTDNPRFPLLSVPVTPMQKMPGAVRTAAPSPPRTAVLPPSILARPPAGASNPAALPPAPLPRPDPGRP